MIYQICVAFMGVVECNWKQQQLAAYLFSFYIHVNNASTQYSQIAMPIHALRHYFLQGVLEADISQDGGPICAAEIPLSYHLIASALIGALYLLLFLRYNHALLPSSLATPLKPNLIERIAFALGVLCLAGITFMKLYTRKGIFIFNPCHACLLMELILLSAKDNTSPFTRKLHTAWQAWLFGAVLALSFPHLEGVGVLQTVFYYYEHLLILPFGPFLLHRRYGFARPSWLGCLASYATLAWYQLWVLAPLGRLTEVNLNYALCHTPADPSFGWFGHHYFVFQSFNLLWVSAVVAWVFYGLTRLLQGNSAGGKRDSKQS